MSAAILHSWAVSFDLPLFEPLRYFLVSTPDITFTSLPVFLAIASSFSMTSGFSPSVFPITRGSNATLSRYLFRVSSLPAKSFPQSDIALSCINFVPGEVFLVERMTENVQHKGDE
jgi:hypothetical protein